MNEKIVGIYGKTDTGKTNLIVDIIKQLSSEGLKIASIKITDKKIGIDSKGKDTFRHGEAGSKLVVFSSPVETDLLLKQTKDISEVIKIINKIGKYDLIIVEGANDKYIPKIRIGDIAKRDNTILTYTDNFQELINIIKTIILGG